MHSIVWGSGRRACVLVSALCLCVPGSCRVAQSEDLVICVCMVTGECATPSRLHDVRVGVAYVCEHV
jgi:hypothetical protein